MNSVPRLRLVLFSFGFKYGAPVDINQLWDVRFLPNPYWVEELRPQTGLTPEVGAYVLESATGSRFLSLFLPLVQCVVVESLAAGKKSLRFAIGCTGGRHRSVAVVERLAAALSLPEVELSVFHRDIERDG
jgi:RNase adapter protein RapZ